jgi:IS4 transposase
MKALPGILDICYRLLHDPTFVDRAKTSPSAFTRKRKLSFVDFMLFLISGAKNSLQSELNHFLDMTKHEDQNYSKQAFSQGRQRIRPEAFKELSDTVVREVYKKVATKTWKMHHLLAIDGSRLNLPINPNLSLEFGEQITSGAAQPQALCSCLFDVLNGIIVDARLDGCRGNERKHAEDMIRAVDTSLISNPVYLMDRGYPSYEMLAMFEQLGQNYVMRCDTTFLKAVCWKGMDTVVTHKFSKAKEPIQFRLVTVSLPSGEQEYLITNLYDSGLSVKDFSDLYHKRWGIETRYNDLKGKLQIENFTGNTPIAVKQDFFATLYLANLAGVIAIDYRDEVEAIHNIPENSCKYQMNLNLVISQLKQNVISLLLCDSHIEQTLLLARIARRLKSAVVPSRSGRSFPRKKQHALSKYPQNRKLP